MKSNTLRNWLSIICRVTGAIGTLAGLALGGCGEYQKNIRFHPEE